MRVIKPRVDVDRDHVVHGDDDDGDKVRFIYYLLIYCSTRGGLPIN